MIPDTSSCSNPGNTNSQNLDQLESDHVITVMTVDDHYLVRAGIKEAIEHQSDLRLVAEAINGIEAIEKFHVVHPEITLMDISMPKMDGVDALIAIRRQSPFAKIIMLSTYSGDIRVRNAMRAGAAGFLLKNTLRTDLLDVIRMVHAGQSCITPEVAMELAEYRDDGVLSPRETEALKLAAIGQSNKRIASRMAITEDTVKAHMKSVLYKLDANDRTHAVIIALQRGIITL